MKVFRWLNLIVISILLAACGTGGTGAPLFGPSPTPLWTPVAAVTHAPDASAAVTAWFDALKNNDFASLYAMLSKANRDALSQDDFTKRYTDALNTLSAASFDVQPGVPATTPFAAEAPFRITYKSALAGDIQRDIIMHLTLEDGQWRVQWDDGLILPELAGGNRLVLDCKAPARGDIYDRNGQPLVTETEAVALGVNTGEIDNKTVGNLLFELNQVTGVNQENLRNQIIASGPGWYLPVGTTSVEEAQRLLNTGLPGLVTN